MHNAGEKQEGVGMDGDRTIGPSPAFRAESAGLALQQNQLLTGVSQLLHRAFLIGLSGSGGHLWLGQTQPPCYEGQ